MECLRRPFPVLAAGIDLPNLNPERFLNNSSYHVDINDETATVHPST